MGQRGNGNVSKSSVSGINDKCPVLAFVLNKHTEKQTGSVVSIGIQSDVHL